jgi:hypothetical protein
MRALHSQSRLTFAHRIWHPDTLQLLKTLAELLNTLARGQLNRPAGTRAYAELEPVLSWRRNPLLLDSNRH